MRLVNTPTVAFSTITLWPVCFSNSGTSASSTCLKAPAVSTLISAAAASRVPPIAAMDRTVRPNNVMRMVALLIASLRSSAP